MTLTDARRTPHNMRKKGFIMQGRIRQRTKGSWEVTLDTGRVSAGSRLRKSETVKGKKSDAERRLRELLSTHERGLPVESSKVTVAEFLARWYRDYVVPKTGPRTQMTYESIIRVHLVPHLGTIKLKKVQPSDIQSLGAALLNKGKAARTVLHVQAVLSEALKYAIRWGLLWRNPSDAVDPVRALRKEVQVPDAEAVLGALETARATHHGASIHFVAYTACRRGEGLGLRWQDCDLDRGIVSIVQTVQWVSGQGTIIQPPKNATSRRAISLDPGTVAVLRAHRADQAEHKLSLGGVYQDLGLVFPGPLGKPLDPAALTHAWERIAKKAGIPGVRVHDLRHFHATLLLQMGIHPKVVQERLGHSTISVTLDTYSHVVPGLQEKAALAFAEAMDEGKKHKASM